MRAGGNNVKILHVSSDYPFTSVYEQLLLHFRPDIGQSHLMYVPLPKHTQCRHGLVRHSLNAEVLYSDDYTNFERLLYRRKLGRIRRSIERQVPIQDISVIHAHYLFSAGGIAWQMKQLYGIPYIAAVRNTDLNFFFKFAIHLRDFGVQILKDASRVVFISPAAREFIIGEYVPNCLRNTIDSKSEVIPNGIDDFWLQNMYARPPRPHTSKSISLLYVGEVSKNKNIETSIRVTDTLNQRGYNASLDVVGDGPYLQRIVAMAQKRPETIHMHGRITSKKQLIKLYRNADIFIMPSLTETFGLVYLEAMSQGLPVIYTNYQGIDGYFEDGSIGYGCSPRDQNMIADRVEQVLEDYDDICARCTRAVQEFAWNKIASRYEEIYSSLERYRRN